MMIVAVLAAVTTAGLTFPTLHTAEVPPTATDAPEIDTATDAVIQPRDSDPLHIRTTDTPDDTTGIDAAIEVEIQRRFNDLRSELLDDRAASIDWWLTSVAIFLTVWGIIVALGGYISFNRVREMQAEAREYAKETQSLVEEIRGYREQAEEIVWSMTTEQSSALDEAGRAEVAVQGGRRDPETSWLDIAVLADAYTLQQEGKIEEAIEKWRAIAHDAKGTDDTLAALAWRFVGDLLQKRNRSQ